MNVSESFLKSSSTETFCIGAFFPVYYSFLAKTDHIPNKIIESLVENLADATALNFIKVFIQSLADVRVRYSEILKLRKQAREEINRLEGETAPEPTGTTEEVTE